MIKDDLFCSLVLLIEDIGNVLYLCFIQISNNLDLIANVASGAFHDFYSNL